MLDSAVILDCEFLTAEGAPQRHWCGPFDPDPTVVQIGAIRLGLSRELPILDQFEAVIQPVDRYGMPVVPDPALVRLTGLATERLAAEGQTLVEALSKFATFVEDDLIWSWGKDEINLMAISPWIAGIPALLPPGRFANACHLCLKAGVPLAEVQSLRSHTLCRHFGLTSPEGTAHDARHDALSVACALRYLVQEGRLDPADLASAP